MMAADGETLAPEMTGEPLTIPYAAPAQFGTPVEIAPGILWAQLPLPYQPGHVNTYLIADGDGWCAVDAGLLDDDTKAAWEKIVAALPGRRKITQVLVTHWHSDHSGAAGWLCEKFAAPLLMSEAEYLKALWMEFFPRNAAGEVERAFYRSHGLDPETTEKWVRSGHDYLYMAAPLPHVYRRLVAGSEMVIGDRSFTIRTASGHSPEEVMMKAAAGDVYFCADQCGPKIAPNVAVQSYDPLGDPLAHYLRSLDDIELDRPDQALILPGHEPPFRGFARRGG